MAQKIALVILANGAEDMESAIIIDTLRRGDVNVLIAGLENADPVTCKYGMVITPDIALADAPEELDAIVLPGGEGGAKLLGEAKAVGDIIRTHNSKGRIVGAMCAAPLALMAHELFRGYAMTAYPDLGSELDGFARYEHATTLIDRNLITAPGPGCTFIFALSLLRKLVGEGVVQTVRSGLVLP